MLGHAGIMFEFERYDTRIHPRNAGKAGNRPATEMLKRVVEELKTVRTSLYADAGSEPPPPHY